ncbi:MAG: PAS domain-containing protein [Deltaproteobacteria bacterium]|nr:PAS domain-containing protein [Deltaproteobacteria bacterium]
MSDDLKPSFSVKVHNSHPIGDVSDVENLGRGVYWVGIRNQDVFHLNPYLIVDGDDAVLIDPGGLLHAEATIARVRSIVDLKQVKYIVAQHQDPDVISAAIALRELVHEDCAIVCHSRMSVLIEHLGAGFPFYHVDENDFELQLSKSRRLTFAHTPYLHSPGAIVTYDKKTQTVFTSDIFGGVTPEWELYAEEETVEALKAFHVSYMPSPQILKSGLDQIRKLGRIARIAPQHGSIIEGHLVEGFLAYMDKLEVGTYADELFRSREREYAHALRMQQVVESSSAGIMAADTEGKLVYMNPAAKALFRTVEQVLPVPVDQMVGQSVDIFHKDPPHQRQMMDNPKRFFPRNATLQFADRFFFFSGFAVHDDSGKYLGPAVQWEDVTEKREREEKEQRIQHRVVHIAQELANASRSLKDLSLNLSSTAEETSTQADVVSHAALGVSGKIKDVVSSLSEVSDAMNGISADATTSSQVAAEAVRLAGDADTAMGALVQSSGEIGKVIRVISSIAQQTNLLALNATIEAARAGDMGRGFAVVANAIKELANKTTDSTEDITEKIEKIQHVAQGAAASLANITDIIGRINDIAQGIADSVDRQTGMSRAINSNMQGAAYGVDEISSNIVAVAEAATDTAQGAAASLQAAESLTSISDGLSQVLEDMK